MKIGRIEISQSGEVRVFRNTKPRKDGVTQAWPWWAIEEMRQWEYLVILDSDGNVIHPCLLDHVRIGGKGYPGKSTVTNERGDFTVEPDLHHCERCKAAQ